MLLSMTGYGRTNHTAAGKTYHVEIRALNSKQSDLRLRSSIRLHRFELPLRKLIMETAQRGKLEVTLEITGEDDGAATVNMALLGGLYDDILHRLPDYTQQPIDTDQYEGLLAGLLRIPGVIEAGSKELQEDEWSEVLHATQKCLEKLYAYRKTEGEAMASDLKSNTHSIIDALSLVSEFEGDRIQTVRERMQKNLDEYMGRANVDKNRFEQEVLFYLEKIDINEEKVRLRQNCQHFLEVLTNHHEIKGRKLAFISQEIGREINTLGAKAYSTGIQKLVVGMKENLEMIKEQLANVA